MEEDQRKGFNNAWTLTLSTHFLYFRAIQGGSGGNLVDPALQDNVLLPEDFTEYIYHVGNVSEIPSIIRSGLIPQGKSLKKRDSAIRVFHCSEPDGRWSKHGRNSMRLRQAKDRTIQKYLETSSKVWYIGAIQSSLRRKDCNIIKHHHTQSLCLQHTTCDLYWECGMHAD